MGKETHRGDEEDENEGANGSGVEENAPQEHKVGCAPVNSRQQVQEEGVEDVHGNQGKQLNSRRDSCLANRALKLVRGLKSPH